MGRQELDWQDLRANGAKPHRWKARKTKQETEAAEDAHKERQRWNRAAFMQVMRFERETFSLRLRAAETVLRLLDCSEFTWPSDHPASRMRDICYKHIERHGTIMHRFCSRILADLENGAAKGCYFDPVASGNLEHWLRLASGRDLRVEQLTELEMFDAVNIVGWKLPNGKHRLYPRWIEMTSDNEHLRESLYDGAILLDEQW